MWDCRGKQGRASVVMNYICTFITTLFIFTSAAFAGGNPQCGTSADADVVIMID